MRRWVIALSAAILAVGIAAGAAEKKAEKQLDKAKETVDPIREADPPSVSTGTKPSPVGVPTEQFKPKGPSVRPKEVPSPSKDASKDDSKSEKKP